VAAADAIIDASGSCRRDQIPPARAPGEQAETPVRYNRFGSARSR
jgi:hypothetical protein